MPQKSPTKQDIKIWKHKLSQMPEWEALREQVDCDEFYQDLGPFKRDKTHKYWTYLNKSLGSMIKWKVILHNDGKAPLDALHPKRHPWHFATIWNVPNGPIANDRFNYVNRSQRMIADLCNHSGLIICPGSWDVYLSGLAHTVKFFEDLAW